MDTFPSSNEASHRALGHILSMATTLRGSGFDNEAKELGRDVEKATVRLQELSRAGALVGYLRESLALRKLAQKVRSVGFSGAENALVYIYRDDLNESGWVLVSVDELREGIPSHFIRLALRQADAETKAQEVESRAWAAFEEYIGAADGRAAALAMLEVAKRYIQANKEFPGIGSTVCEASLEGAARAEALRVAGEGGSIYRHATHVAAVTSEGRLIALPNLFAKKDDVVQHCSRHGLDRQSVAKLIRELRQGDTSATKVYAL